MGPAVKIKTLNLAITCFSTDLKCSVLILMEEIKHVFSEKFEFEDRVKSGILALLDYFDCAERQKTVDSSLKYSCTSREFPPKTYRKELRLVFSEKSDLQRQ